MHGWAAYLAQSRERHIRGYKALPDKWHRERQWRRQEALRYAAMLREFRRDMR